MHRFLIAAAFALAASAAAHDYRAGPLTIAQPWTRATPAGAVTAPAYFTIANNGAADRLLSASSPAARRVTLHRSELTGGMAHMAALSGVAVPARGQVAFAPGGLHLMLEGLTRPLAAGATVPVMLRFERARAVVIGLTVAPPGAVAAPR